MDSTSVLSWLRVLYQNAKEMVVGWEPSQLYSSSFQELSKFNEKLHFLRVLYFSICGQFCVREYLCKSDRCQNPVPKKIKARMYCVLAFNMKWWVATQMEFLFPFPHSIPKHRKKTYSLTWTGIIGSLTFLVRSRFAKQRGGPRYIWLFLNLEMNKTKSSHRYATSFFGTIIKVFEICSHVHCPSCDTNVTLIKKSKNNFAS